MPDRTPARRRKACVIGSGPNGLAAAIVLAQAGLEVELFEAEPTSGGATRTLELTLPGFHHDFGSAVHPMGVGSPFFSSLPLEDYGLEWLHSPAPLAHPFDDGTAITLERNLAAAEASLGSDGQHWRSLIEPFATRWPALAADILGPILRIPKHPLLLARFGRNAVLPAATVARRHLRTPQAQALFAGLAAHSFMELDQPLSASFGLVLAATAHAVGWPIPRGGSQSIANALAAHLAHLGGRITTGTRINRLIDLPACDLTLCDITPRQLLALAPASRLTETYRRQLSRFQYGPGVFKVDYALSAPIPWNDPACLRAATVHLGGTLAEIAASESAMSSGRHSAKPFVLLSQPTLFDPTRAPASKHIAWAYCHIPNARTHPAPDPDLTLECLEAQIERFATGFRGTILARHISTPAKLEAMDANLIGGDISGGAVNLRQLLFRPTRRQYRTSAPDLYLCGASTPPGGGVHGMCGYHAARTALRRLHP
jgi:phytoene dehydrogenase-like protein